MYTVSMSEAGSLPTTLSLGPVHLTVHDVDRSVAWYERSLGLRAGSRGHGVAELGDGATTLVVLHEDPEAKATTDHAGMFHYCLLYPTQEELARAALRIEATDTPVHSMFDRGTHPAIYLPDLDGNMIELAHDRPREEWPADPYGHTPVPLDLPALLAPVEGEQARPSVAEGLGVGHVHLSIGDVDAAVSFYCDRLGFDLRYRVYYGAFFSVDGYHHHAAANTRRGEGVGPQPPHTIGLRAWTIRLADADEVAAVRARLEAAGEDVAAVEGGFTVEDPWRIPVRVVA